MAGITALRRIPGEEGTWIFIFGDMTVFALLFGVYLSARGQAPAIFADAQGALDQNYGAVNTLLLLSSSILVVAAVRAIRSASSPAASRLVLGAIACGMAFCASKYLEWSHHLHQGFTPATNDFWLYYYVLTGLHLFHLLLGLGALTYVHQQARTPELSVRSLAFVEGGACFWHMVDALWIVLFPLLYLVR